MMICSWILKTCKCCDVLSIDFFKKGIISSQSFVLKKGLIKYNHINGIIPMKIHVDILHPKLFALRKTQL